MRLVFRLCASQRNAEMVRQPSHHIPYLYALAGAASKTQERVREIAKANYNNTPVGLSGVSVHVVLNDDFSAECL
jgi:putative alpha-1,2-mannosidase